MNQFSPPSLPGYIQEPVLPVLSLFSSIYSILPPKSSSPLALLVVGDRGGWCHQPVAQETYWSWRNCLDLLVLLPPLRVFATWPDQSRLILSPPPLHVSKDRLL